MRTLLFLLLLLSLQALGQENNWYKMLSGKIGAYPVVMHLHKSGHTYNGYYYYQSTQQPMALMGEDTSSAGKITLNATGGGNKDGETFRFSMSKGVAGGTWQVSEQARTLAFQAREQPSQTAFQYIAHKAAQPLLVAAGTAARVSYDVAIVWPDASSRVGASIRDSLKQFVANGKDAGDVGTIMRQEQTGFFAAYQKEHAQTKTDKIKEMPSAFTNDQTKRGLVAYYGKAFVSLALFSYEYTGGAHGNYGTQFHSFNLASGKKIGLKEVLTPAGIKALPSLLAAAFRKKEGLSASTPLTEGGLFESIIKPNENYFVTGKALAFNYQPYEIGPYALGEIILYLPFIQIKKYLQPAFQATLKKN